ncbi:MAG: DUF6607 family protein [Phycisphaerae bacterium]
MIRTLLATLLVTASSAFAAAQSSTAPEADRAAILAMAGRYTIDFNFAETVPLADGYELKKPYHAEATELVEVIEDAGDTITLQHILVLDNEENPGQKRVVKHWRQTWVYEDDRILEYAGDRTWRTRTLSPAEAAGTWSQQVFQVDDGPRYESFGAWNHAAGTSSWQGNATWRPLPRREYTKRDDYDVLVAANRHTITPAGWVHEQDNAKLVTRDGRQELLVREVGLNTYARTPDADLAAGETYWQKTAPFWAEVRKQWTQILSRDEVRLHADVDGLPLHSLFFDYAMDVEETGTYDAADGQQFVKETLDALVKDDRRAEAK